MLRQRVKYQQTPAFKEMMILNKIFKHDNLKNYHQNLIFNKMLIVGENYNKIATRRNLLHGN